MRVLRIRIENYRGCASHEVRFGPGVTVIEGPNEAGKSSLAEALDLIFDYPVTSKHRAVRDLFTVGKDTSPEIEVDIETGPYSFRYLKRFGRTASAARTELQILEPKPQNLAGSDAHDRAREILQETLDIDLWRAIRIEQGRGVDQATLKDSDALSRALDAASSGSSGNEEDPALFQRVDEEVQRYFTAKEGKPKGELARSEQDVAALRLRVAELDAKLREIEHHIEESSRISDRRRRLDDELPKRRAELANRDAEAKKLDALRAELSDAANESERAERAAETAARAHQDRGELARRVAELEARVATLDADRRTSDEAAKELALQIAAAKQRRDKARAASEAAERAEKLARDDAQYRRTELDAAQLGERLERVRVRQREAREARDLLATNRVTREALAEIQEAEHEVRGAHRRLEEGGPRLVLHALAATCVEIAGEPVALADGEERELAIPRETTLRVPGVLELRFRPGTRTGDLETAWHSATKQLAVVLERYDVASVEAAIRANLAREAATRTAEEAAQRLADDLRDLGIDRLEEKSHRARAEVEAYRTRRAAEPPLPPTLEAANEALLHAEATSQTARQEVDRAMAAHEPLLTHHTERTGELSRIETQLDGARRDLAALAERLTAGRAEDPDLELAKLRDETAARAQAALATRVSLQTRLEAAQPNEIEALRNSAQAALSGAETEFHELDKEAARVGALLDASREAGLFETLEASRARLLHAEQARDALVRRSEAARRLHQTLARHRDEARRAYIEPLRQQIDMLGRVVFGPSFAIQLDQDLAIEARTLDGTTLAFDQLTTGTREQLGLLARLAAAMIVAPHEGVPLIVDDALGHSDPERIQRMNAAIGLADCQVIILTCWPERFRGVAGACWQRL